MSVKKSKNTLPKLATIYANDLISNYHRKVNQAKEEGRIIPWVSFGLPALFFYAHGTIPVYPQIVGGLQSARGKHEEIASTLEGKWEIPQELCGEAKGMVGLALEDNPTVFKIPQPDCLVASGGACSQMPLAFQFLRNYKKIPYYLLDIPTYRDNYSSDLYVDYITRQLKDISRQFERDFGLKVNEQKLYGSTIYGYFYFIIWKEILKLYMLTPAPTDAHELLAVMQPFLVCDPVIDKGKTIDFLIFAYNELYKIYMENRTSGKKREKHRLLWDWQPPYKRRKFFRNILEKYDAKIVMTNFIISGIRYFSKNEDLIFEYPVTRQKLMQKWKELKESFPMVKNIEKMDRFESYARVILNDQDLRRTQEAKFERIKWLIDVYDVDAVIMGMDTKCRFSSSYQIPIARYIKEELKLPLVMFDASNMDGRHFPEAQIKTRIEAFMESLD